MIDRTSSGSSLAQMTALESAQFAAEQIRRAIINGEFQPGQRLVEQNLTESLSLSRHPVREALRLLAREGFVEIRRNRGAVVSAVDVGSVVEVYEIRKALGRFALNYLLGDEAVLTPAALQKIQFLANNALILAEEDDQEASIANDLEFQQSIIDATGLQRTARYFSELTGDVRRFNNMLGAVYTDRAGDAWQYIFSLYKAIKDLNLDLAQAIWSSKFETAAKRYVSLIKDKGSDGATSSRRPKD